MMTMILNGSARIPINSYNRYINIVDGKVRSNASFSCTGSGIIDSLLVLAANPITSIEVQNDGTSIYDLENLNAKLTNLNENIYDGKVNVSAEIKFDHDSEDDTAEEGLH